MIDPVMIAKVNLRNAHLEHRRLGDVFQKCLLDRVDTREAFAAVKAAEEKVHECELQLRAALHELAFGRTA